MTFEAMSCGAVERRLEDYLAGDLEPAEENRLASHLLACPQCSAEVALAERIEIELAALPAFDAPPELIARIKAQARQPATVVSLASRRPRRVLWRAALAAGVAAALALGWWQSDKAAQPSAAEIAAADRQARYALALVGRIGRKASAEVRDEVLIQRIAVPVLSGVGRSFMGGMAAKTGGLES